MVQFLLYVLSLCWFAVSVRNQNPFLDVYFQDPRSKVLRRIRSCSSLQKFGRVTYRTRGFFFYLKPVMNILHFGYSLSRRDVGFQRRDVSMSRRQFVPPLERRDVGSQRRDVGLDLLWNVATLDPNVAMSFFVLLRNVAMLDTNITTLVLITLWNVAKLHSHVTTLTLFKAKPPQFCLNLSAPFVVPPAPTLAGAHSHTLTDTATTISFHIYLSTVPVSRHPHYIRFYSHLLGLVLHIRSSLGW